MTRRKDRRSITELIGELALLFTTVLVLIRDSKREPDMITRLRRALQLFKENRLGEVMQLAGADGKLDKAVLFDLLSKEIQETDLPSRAKEYLYECGVVYVGEIFLVMQYWGTRVFKSRTQIEAFLHANLIPLDLDPIQAGWEPSYWGEQAPGSVQTLEWLRGKLDRIVAPPNVFSLEDPVSVLKLEAYRLGYEHYGTLIPWAQQELRRMRQLQKQFSRSSRTGVPRGLRMGFCVPTDWSVPGARTPEVWERFTQDRLEVSELGRALRQRRVPLSDEIARQLSRSDEEANAELSLFQQFANDPWMLWALHKCGVTGVVEALELANNHGLHKALRQHVSTDLRPYMGYMDVLQRRVEKTLRGILGVSFSAPTRESILLGLRSKYAPSALEG